MKFVHSIVVSFVFLLQGSAVAGDSVLEQIEAGVKAYKAGEYKQAITELNFAIAEIQSRIDEVAKQVLPDPLPGWKAEEAEAQSMAMMGMGGTTISRSYYREDGEARVEIQIVADSPMIQMFAMMMTNPMMMQGDPSTKVFRHNGKRGLMKHEKNSREWEATLLLGNGRIMVQVNGSNLADDSAVMAYLDALDLKKIENSLGQ
ncbi:MAG: hypothetical protein DSZ00_08135 [Gammaproteobacteria bacterium]|nr:MAG: hypothetical protein DSZ00_08135 [Gammaproteobacteria bacterium]